MCGRFTITADGATIVAEFGLPDVPFDYRPRYNVAPLQDVLAIVGEGDKRRAGWMRWGLVPSWADEPAVGSRMINARSETIAERPAFREAFEKRRCLIVADGFYEWKRVGDIKVPTRITLKNRRPFAFAGLWERWSGANAEPLITCTILTTTPAPSLASIHDRMPVILPQEARGRWLNRDEDAEALKGLLRPYADEALDVYVVAPVVNRVENDSPECVEPARSGAAEQTSLF